MSKRRRNNCSEEQKTNKKRIRSSYLFELDNEYFIHNLGLDLHLKYYFPDELIMDGKEYSDNFIQNLFTLINFKYGEIEDIYICDYHDDLISKSNVKDVYMNVLFKIANIHYNKFKLKQKNYVRDNNLIQFLKKKYDKLSDIQMKMNNLLC